MRRSTISGHTDFKEMTPVPQYLENENAGLIPRVLKYLYMNLEGSLLLQNCELRISYLEIYNDQVTDLLDFNGH